ncbi:unnamed protein product [Dicrocoelium dendriticum]|nr:unnamed protein product [Dicrocoelium dendriticum]
MPNDRTSPDTACGSSTDCLPVLHVPLLQMIRTIRDRLRDEQVNLREIRLNGGAAGCVIDSAGEKYSDLDLIFHVDLSNPATFVKVKSVVFSTVAHFLAEAFASSFTECNCGSLVFYKRLFTPTCIPIGLQHNSTRVSSTPEPDLGRAADPCESQTSKGNVSAKSRHNCLSSNRNSNTGLRFQSQPNPDCAYRHSTCCFPWYTALQDESWLVKFYVQKMLRIHKPSLKTADSWSLFTLGYRTSSGAKTLDIKFVDRMQRQFEFTVDSFQIVLDSLLTFYETSRHEMNENFYPTVVAESVSGSFTEALSHLQERLIVTPRPEEIRGGGLLKYCKLLADGYRPTKGTDVLSMERYMCSRFFIDFPDIVSQHHRLNYYLTNHFEDDNELKAAYLQDTITGFPFTDSIKV